MTIEPGIGGRIVQRRKVVRVLRDVKPGDDGCRILTVLETRC